MTQSVAVDWFARCTAIVDEGIAVSPDLILISDDIVLQVTYFQAFFEGYLFPFLILNASY